VVADRGHTADYVSVGQLSAKGASWHDSASWRKRSFGWHSDVGLIDQRIVPRPKLESLTYHDRDTVRSDWDMEIDPEASDSRVNQKRDDVKTVTDPAKNTEGYITIPALHTSKIAPV
jgi:hypothetical protein